MPGLIASRVVKRLSRGLPIVQVWTIGNLAVLAGRHAGRLDGAERRRLAQLVAKGRGRPSRLSPAEATQLRELTGRLELRLFLGTAVSRLVPVRLPKRLLYGRKGSSARTALAQQQERAAG
ncbi:MAG: hypothetical protein JWM31_3292 [Solirubrobacterales bacterium]|nr:hypothetical protein [Solirubrobacterales bacterium]